MLYSHKTWAKNGAIEMCVEKNQSISGSSWKKMPKKALLLLCFGPFKLAEEHISSAFYWAVKRNWGI